MKKLFLFAMTVACLSIFNACEKSEELIDHGVDDSILLKSGDMSKKEEYDKNIRKIAKALAKTLKDEDLRRSIKEEAMLRIDGDYDIIWKDFNNNKVRIDGEEYTFNEVIAENIDDETKTKMQKKDELDDFEKKHKKLQISVPILCEQWDIENYMPLVAYLPSDYSESWTEIEAFDAQGKSHMIDAQKEPEFPVIVIGKNERSDENGDILPDYLNLNLKSMPIDDGDGGGGGGSTSTGCDRETNISKDVLNKAKFNSVDAFRTVESWPSGRPEMKVIITYIERFGTNYSAKTLTKILTKDDWITRYVLWTDLKTKNIDIEILSWDHSIYGESMKYTWIEMDDGDPIEYSTSVASKYDDITLTQAVKITITDEDDEAGDGLVQYCDDTSLEGTEYNTGILTFWINQ